MRILILSRFSDYHKVCSGFFQSRMAQPSPKKNNLFLALFLKQQRLKSPTDMPQMVGLCGKLISVWFRETRDVGLELRVSELERTALATLDGDCGRLNPERRPRVAFLGPPRPCGSAHQTPDNVHPGKRRTDSVTDSRSGVLVL